MHLTSRNYTIVMEHCLIPGEVITTLRSVHQVPITAAWPEAVWIEIKLAEGFLHVTHASGIETRTSWWWTGINELDLLEVPEKSNPLYPYA